MRKIANVTIAISPELKHEMEQFPEINWSEVIRIAIRQKIVDLHFMKEFSAHSSLSPEEAEKLGTEVNQILAAKYRENK